MSMDPEYEPEFDEYIEKFVPDVIGITTEQIEGFKGTLKEEETIKLNQKIIFKTMVYEWMKRINPECFDEGGEPLYLQDDEECEEYDVWLEDLEEIEDLMDEIEERLEDE